MLRSVCLCLSLTLCSPVLIHAVEVDTPFTFLVTSDSHYEAHEKIERNERNRVTIEHMNEIADIAWPDKLGGGQIRKPQGVLALGDLIDDGDKRNETVVEWQYFTEHFGCTGTEGLLKYPVFEGWGNHDGPPEQFIKQMCSVQSELKKRNALRMEKKLISRMSENGLHYSWDWHGVHFVQTNLYPADKQNTKVRYSLPWHDPQHALQFLQEDLKAAVGDSGRPVVVMAHCGFDTDWWVAEDWTALYNALKPYNILAYFHGHTGTGVRKWKPEGESIPLDVINTGQTEKGFFVVEVNQEKMRLGYRIKKDVTALKNLEWEWKYTFEKPLSKNLPVKNMTAQPMPTENQPAVTLNTNAKKLRFAVIGDFGLDNYKPKTTAKLAEETAKTNLVPKPEATKKEDDDEEPVNPNFVTSKQQRNPYQAAVAKLVHSWKPDFVVTTGDNNYPKGEASTIDDNIGKYYSEFIGNYRGNFGKGANVNRFFPVLGNHDWDSPKSRSQAYVDYFTLPGNERYYDFVQGPLHFIMLDNDGREPDGVKPNTKQHAWFEKTIAASKSPLQIVVAHHPPYSSGDHGGIQVANWNFEKYGVDLMLCGHDHNYERIEKNGLTYIINGAGGASLRRFKKIVEGSTARYNAKHGAMLMESEEQNGNWVLHGQFVNVDGEVIDKFTIQTAVSTAQ